MPRISLAQLEQFCRNIADGQALDGFEAYRWLQHELPRLMARAPAPDDRLRHAHFLIDLITHYYGVVGKGGAQGHVKQPRQDRQRAGMRKDMDDLARRLWSAPWLTPARVQMLVFELRAASDELKKAPAHRKKAAQYPEVHRFAHRFLRGYKIADDASLLLEFARWTGIECDERTAQRYIKDAAKA